MIGNWHGGNDIGELDTNGERRIMHHLVRRHVTLMGALSGLLFALAFAPAAKGQWRVGLSRAKVTPAQPIVMAGYAPCPSQGVLSDLYAKAVVFQDEKGQRALLVTADLLFFRAPFAEALCQRIQEKTGLTRPQIQLNASHTHAGPVFGLRTHDRYQQLPDEQRQVVVEYTQRLLDQLTELAAGAIADLKPARLSWGVGRAGAFVMNRRQIDEHGRCVGMLPNPQGPVDRDVPVLRIDDPDGRLRAVVFGCACHCVTLDGHNRKISGDYAGFAQQYIEEKHPGAQALFVVGCGADANTHPRGGPKQAELARQHGEGLGREVCRVAAGPLRAVRGPLQLQLEWTDLPLEHSLSREQLEKIANGKSPWHARNAKSMLATLDRGEQLPRYYRTPFALWQFGNDLTIVGLPGEAVADYVPMLRKALGPDRLWVMAYCNESFGYLPTDEILAQGGHETIGLTLDFGFFAPGTQDVVLRVVRGLAQEAGRKLPQ